MEYNVEYMRDEVDEEDIKKILIDIATTRFT
jgi:hypothetical protein